MKEIYPYLTYAGAIPFVVGALCLSFGVEQLPGLGSVSNALSVYALVIASFLAGAHWGQHLKARAAWGLALAISSNIIAVLLWLGFVLLSFQALLLAFISAFVALLAIDQRLLQSQLISKQYWQTRYRVSGIVIIALVVMLTASLH